MYGRYSSWEVLTPSSVLRFTREDRKPQNNMVHLLWSMNFTWKFRTEKMFLWYNSHAILQNKKQYSHNWLRFFKKTLPRHFLCSTAASGSIPKSSNPFRVYVPSSILSRKKKQCCQKNQSMIKAIKLIEIWKPRSWHIPSLPPTQSTPVPMQGQVPGPTARTPTLAWPQIYITILGELPGFLHP